MEDIYVLIAEVGFPITAALGVAFGFWRRLADRSLRWRATMSSTLIGTQGISSC